MAKTYQAISTGVVGSGGASSIDFTDVPQTYTDLVVKFSLRDSRESAGPGYLHLKFNDVTSGYSSRHLNTSTDDGVISTQSRSDDYVTFAINTNYSTASTFCNGELYVLNYTGTNYKSVSIDSVSESNTAYDSAVRQMSVFSWANSAAVTKITIYGDSNFKQHSTATLYGIKNS
jgi:hypothetical protein